MKLLSTSLLIIFMLFVQRIDSTITKSKHFRKLDRVSLLKNKKSHGKHLKQSPIERKLQSKAPRVLSDIFDSMTMIIDGIIVLVIVMYLLGVIQKAVSGNKKSLKLKRRLASVKNSKEIRTKDVLSLPKNKNFPAFVKRLKTDIVRILDKHYLRDDYIKPSVQDAIYTLSPYLKSRFYFKNEGFAKLQENATKLFEMAQKNPNLLPNL